jgi:predicted dehydrogenase
MRILIIGLGSMGKRRVGNLQKLDRVSEVRGWDPREDRRKEAEEKRGIKTFADIGDAYAWQPDGIVISTPPNYHTKYCLEVADLKIPFFVEASVIDDGLDRVIEKLNANKSRGVPSCTMRFHDQVGQIKKLLDGGALGDIQNRIGFTYHMGQYLPDWHPHEDYRKFYVGQRETSASREMVCFETVWLSWLVGLPNAVAAQRTKLTALDADIDDIYQLLLKYESGTYGMMMIDVIARFPFRHLRLISEDGIIEWSAIDRSLKLFDGKKGAWQILSDANAAGYQGGNFTGEEMYVREMDNFLNVVEGDSAAFPYSFEEDRRVLKTLAAAEESDDNGTWVNIT